MEGYLVTADCGVVTVFPPSWRRELSLAAAEHAALVDQGFEELLRRHARKYAGHPWAFSVRNPLRLVGAAARRLSAGQRVFLAVMRLCAVQRYAGSRAMVLDGSVFAVLDEEHCDLIGTMAEATGSARRRGLAVAEVDR